MSTSSLQLKKLWWVGPLTVLSAVIGVLIVRILAIAILQPNPAPPGLGWILPPVFTFILCSGAVIVFALVGRFSKNPVRVYLIISSIFLAISFLPDIAVASAPIPGAGWPYAITLMIMHLVAAVITVSMLIKLTTAESK